MKIFRFLTALCCILLMSGCWWTGPGEEDFPQEQNYEAVILERAEFENAVQLLPAREVIKSGKIYVKENFLYINEVNKGFHIYAYVDEQTPVPIGFIQIPGATDLAVRGDVLFINQAVDLVAMRYDPSANTITVTKRNRNTFPQKPAPDFSYADVSDSQIIVDWIPNN